MYLTPTLTQEFDDGSPIRFKRTKNSTKAFNSQKDDLGVIDERNDDTIEQSKSFDQHNQLSIQESTGHVYHLDDFQENEGFLQPLHTSVTNKDKYKLIDEESDEDLDTTSYEGVWVNINDL